MKTLKKLQLSDLSEDKLMVEKEEQKHVLGGYGGDTNNPPERPICNKMWEINTNTSCWDPTNCNSEPNKC